MRLGFTLDACKIDDVLLPYHHHHRVKPLLPPLLHLQLHTIDAHHCSTTTPPLSHYKLSHQQIEDSLDLIVAIELICRIIFGFYRWIWAGKWIWRRASHGRERGRRERAEAEKKEPAAAIHTLTLSPRALGSNAPGRSVKP